MKRFRIATALFAIAATLAASRAIAQHEQHQAGPQAGPSATTTAPMPSGMNMGQSTMSGGMTCSHQEVQQLTNQILKSFAALETERDGCRDRATISEGFGLKRFA